MRRTHAARSVTTTALIVHVGGNGGRSGSHRAILKRTRLNLTPAARVTEARKRLIDVTDPRFSLPENADVLAFIARTSPFAHGDVGSLLFDLARELPGAQAYCPAPRQFAYVVLHSATNRIFAIAHGQRKLAFRLAGTPRADALADGATPADGIAADWIYIEPWPAGVTTASDPARLRRIAELALSQLDTSAGGTE